MDELAQRRLDRSGWELDFAEDFTDAALDPDRWVPDYLPQWSTPDRSAARYDLRPGSLRLRIDADQPAWRPEDGQLRVSGVQTGSFGGEPGAALGTHRHRPDLVVRTRVPTRRLWTPSGGLLEVRLRASPDPACMLAAWLVGFEEAGPEQSGEVCIAELFGSAIGPGGSTVRVGIKAHHDPGLTTDLADVALDIDATEWHSYAATWAAGEARFFVDDREVCVVRQAPAYPLQLMIDLFEFPRSRQRDPAGYPKTGEVGPVRGYRRAAAATTAATRAGAATVRSI